MRTLLISGGSSGIGQATARLFARNGYRVYEMSRSGVSCDGVVHIDGDVTRPEDCWNAVSWVLDHEDKIDLLICNAGMGISGAVEFSSQEEMHRQMDVNFFGAVYLVQAVLPSMRQRFGGRIILVSSLAALFSIPFQSFYSASKSALNSLALSLRNEVAPYGISVGVLLPGDVKSGFTVSRQKSICGADLYPLMENAVHTMEKDEVNGQSTERIAARLWSLAHRKRLPIYNYEGFRYRLLVLLYKILPQTVLNWIVGKLY